MSAHTTLDPYTAKAEKSSDLTPQEKITRLHDIVKDVKCGMLTSRDSQGNMHSRAMAPASPHSDTQLTLVFLANNASHKFDELENDSHVNVSFYDPSSTDWASYSGKATLSQNKDLIKKYWHPTVSAWFGNLGDGIHKGDQNDPRISVIEVVPDEIRFWKSTSTMVGRGASIVTSAITGKVSAPGDLCTINKQEIELTQGFNTK